MCKNLIFLKLCMVFLNRSFSFWNCINLGYIIKGDCVNEEDVNYFVENVIKYL